MVNLVVLKRAGWVVWWPWRAVYLELVYLVPSDTACLASSQRKHPQVKFRFCTTQDDHTVQCWHSKSLYNFGPYNDLNKDQNDQIYEITLAPVGVISGGEGGKILWNFFWLTFSSNQANLSTFRFFLKKPYFFFIFFPKKSKWWSLCLPCTFKNVLAPSMDQYELIPSWPRAIIQ